MASIIVEDVKKIAKLVKLDVSGQEETFVKMFEETLDYIKILDELDTSKVGETYQVTGLTNVFQKEDHPKNTLDHTEAIKNARNASDDLFSTKGVFDRPS